MTSAPLHCAWNAVARTVALPLDASIPRMRLLGAQTCIEEFSDFEMDQSVIVWRLRNTYADMAKEFEGSLTLTLGGMGLSAIRIGDLSTQIS